MKLHQILAGLAIGLVLATAPAYGFQLGQIAIGHPYARATAPGQPTGGGYLTLENRGADDRLMSASAAVSASVELHRMAMEGDVMRMRQVDAIDVPKGKKVELKPGAMHIMFVGLKAPLKAGDSFPMTLKFAKAGVVTVQVSVEAVQAEPMRHDTKH